jgi:hypothetical protein
MKMGMNLLSVVCTPQVHKIFPNISIPHHRDHDLRVYLPTEKIQPHAGFLSLSLTALQTKHN